MTLTGLSVRMVTVALSLTAGLSGVAGANADEEDVIVGFGLRPWVRIAGRGLAPPPGVLNTGLACQLTVASGADGFAVLDAAVAKGCIDSYATSPYWDPNDQVPHYAVRCINDACDGDQPVHSIPVCQPHPPPIPLLTSCKYVGAEHRIGSYAVDLFSATGGSTFSVHYGYDIPANH